MNHAWDAILHIVHLMKRPKDVNMQFRTTMHRITQVPCRTPPVKHWLKVACSSQACLRGIAAEAAKVCADIAEVPTHAVTTLWPKTSFQDTILVWIIVLSLL